ncbi:hypothetical protein D3C87_1892790 [compost metagenome]
MGRQGYIETVLGFTVGFSDVCGGIAGATVIADTSPYLGELLRQSVLVKVA